MALRAETVSTGASHEGFERPLLFSWIDEFLEHMAAYRVNSSSAVFWTSSKSLAAEMERNGTVSARRISSRLGFHQRPTSILAVNSVDALDSASAARLLHGCLLVEGRREVHQLRSQSLAFAVTASR